MDNFIVFSAVMLCLGALYIICRGVSLYLLFDKATQVFIDRAVDAGLSEDEITKQFIDILDRGFREGNSIKNKVLRITCALRRKTF